jgi:toxin-antitoxin system PIN domain toxin
MSATIDANVLLYASNTRDARHQRAQHVLGNLAAGEGLVYLFWPVLIGYVRIATHPAVFEDPLAPDEAVANVGDLLERAHVRAPGEAPGFLSAYRAVTADQVVRGNLVTDAHLVALMRQYEVGTVISHDRDFLRFDGIEVQDPFEGTELPPS